MIVWVDLETTGLEDWDKVLEIALVVTDDDLEVRDQWHTLRPLPYPLVMPDIVREMHTKSGLIEDCANLASWETDTQVDHKMQKVLQRNGIAPGTAPLGGASVQFDRRMLRTYFRGFHDMLHYRQVDVRSFKIGATLWAPELLPPQPPEGVQHRAMQDVLHSISEARWFRENLFLPAHKARQDVRDQFPQR